MLIPAGQTEYAGDKAFGYQSSNLRDWVDEKTNGRFSAGQVVSIGLDAIRSGGPPRVAELLSSFDSYRPVVVNAADYSDLDIVVAGFARECPAGEAFSLPNGGNFCQLGRGDFRTTPALERGAR